LGCHYEGDVPTEKVAEIDEKLIQLGCYEVSLGDTIGVGTPGKAQELIKTVAKRISLSQIATHFHDTYGQALANIFAVLQLGINIFDSSVAGLGGCPYASGAAGNVATEDLVYMFNGLHIETGINLSTLVAAGKYISDYLERDPRSKVGTAIVTKDKCRPTT
jgi:hydroxymethylglutaryl-CoA lyase